MEEALHQAGAFEQVAHEGEERHRRQDGVHHRPEKRIGHQVEDPLTETDVAEDHPEGDQRERDREPDTDGEKKDPQEDQTVYFQAHFYLPHPAAFMDSRQRAMPRDRTRWDYVISVGAATMRSSFPVRISFTDLRISESPWSRSREALTGMTSL